MKKVITPILIILILNIFIWAFIKTDLNSFNYSIGERVGMVFSTLVSIYCWFAGVAILED